MIQEQDCCTSMECPRYRICGRALRKGIIRDYYKLSSHTEWADTEGHNGSEDIYYCGERGNWRMFIEK